MPRKESRLSDRAREDSHRSVGWAGLGFGALLIVTVAVRVADPTGWLGSDDAAYHSAAEHVLTGTPIQRVHHHYARMAVILPIAASMAVFGDNAFAVALPMAVASVICVALVVLLGRSLWGWWEGLLAGAAVSVLPYFRVLSTAAFPDVHVCLWATAAMLLAWRAVLSSSNRRAALLWLGAGAAFALAVSAKVFAVATLAGIAALLLSSRAKRLDDPAPPTTGGAPFTKVAARSATMFLTGAAIVQVIDGLFYLWAAGDFFFSLRATVSASQNVPRLAEEPSMPAGWATMAWERLTIFLRPKESGWGVIGIFFWPVIILAAAFNRRARAVAAWAAGVFVLVAFLPVSFKAGAQAYPIFHGRHILPACIPFALCLGWCLCRAGEAMPASWRSAARPVLAILLVALGFVNPRELGGFRNRATSRAGVAVAQAAAAIPDDGRPIFMTPSAYWRYRVLVPQPLRERLRVAAAADAPTWWKDTCADIATRRQPLPSPREAYLLATPRQLRAEAEQWDYGVALPADALAAWQSAPPLATLVRHVDRTIGPPRDGPPPLETVLVLAGPGDPPAIVQAR